MNISLVDMHLRDQRVLSWLSEFGTRDVRITHGEIARQMGCARVTAFNIMRRLELAGYVTVVYRSRRGGHVYRINHAP